MSELSVASTAAEALAAISAAHLGEDKKEKEVYEKLSGPQKAAILLLALGGDTGAIWENLDDEELRDVSLAMSNLGMVEASLVENLIIEFVSKLSTSGALTGSYEQTQKLLTQFLPQ